MRPTAGIFATTAFLSRILGLKTACWRMRRCWRPRRPDPFPGRIVTQEERWVKACAAPGAAQGTKQGQEGRAIHKPVGSGFPHLVGSTTPARWGQPAPHEAPDQKSCCTQHDDDQRRNKRKIARIHRKLLLVACL